MTYASLYLPGIYLNPAAFEKLLNDPETLRSWFFDNRMETIQPALDSDPVYEQKMRDIISELIEEGTRTLK